MTKFHLFNIKCKFENESDERLLDQNLRDTAEKKNIEMSGLMLLLLHSDERAYAQTDLCI